MKWQNKANSDIFVINSGEPGYLEKVEIDTAHFKGNFPESVEIHAINCPEVSTSIYQFHVCLPSETNIPLGHSTA